MPHSTEPKDSASATVLRLQQYARSTDTLPPTLNELPQADELTGSLRPNVTGLIEPRAGPPPCGSRESALRQLANVRPQKTPLHWAAERGDLNECRQLLEMGTFDVDARDEYGETPLHYSAWFGSAGCTRILLDYGADASAVSHGYRASPLEWAQHQRNLAIVAMLTAPSVTPERRSAGTGAGTAAGRTDAGAARHGYRVSLLRWARQRGYITMANMLAAAGAAAEMG